MQSSSFILCEPKDPRCLTYHFLMEFPHKHTFGTSKLLKVCINLHSQLMEHSLDLPKISIKHITKFIKFFYLLTILKHLICDHKYLYSPSNKTYSIMSIEDITYTLILSGIVSQRFLEIWSHSTPDPLQNMIQSIQWSHSFMM